MRLWRLRQPREAYDSNVVCMEEPSRRIVVEVVLPSGAVSAESAPAAQETEGEPEPQPRP
jgi:hypothetical protein